MVSAARIINKRLRMWLRALARPPEPLMSGRRKHPVNQKIYDFFFISELLVIIAGRLAIYVRTNCPFLFH